MATLNRIRAAIEAFRVGGYQVQPRESKAAPFIVWPDYKNGQAQWRQIDLQAYIDEGFNLNTLIYSAVMYKARAASMPRLCAYKGRGKMRVELPVEHPLSQLCARPNPNQSWSEFQMIQEIYLNISGEAFTWMQRKGGAAGVPAAIYPLDPRHVFIIPGPSGKLGYKYVQEGRSVHDALPLLPQDVSHVKFPNPGDNYAGDGYGLSPMSPLARSADVDNAITHFLQIFFRNGAVPSGVLKFDVPLTDPIIGGIKERWAELYGGYENWSQVGVLDRGGSYERIGMNFEEMGFGNLDERNESRILGPFGVPPILIGSRIGLLRSTYSNYEQARTAFWQDTMLGELGLFQDDYQYYLQSDDGGYVEFDYSNVPALQQTLADAQRIAALTGAFAQLLTVGVPMAVAAEIVGLTLPEAALAVSAAAAVAPSTTEMPNAEEEAAAGEKAIMALAHELKLAREALEAETK